MSEKSEKTTTQELPETSRLEQLRMLMDEYIFAVMAWIDKWYGRAAYLGNAAFDKLPLANSKRAALKSLVKKLLIIFGVIFLVFFVFVWLNPLLGFLATIGIACGVFYWPDIAFRYREYMSQKESGTSRK